MQSKTVRIVVVIAVLALFAVAVAAAGCAPTTPTTTTTQPSTTPSTTPSTQPSSTTATTTTTPPTALTGVALGKNIWDTGSDNNGPVKWTQGKAGIKTGACTQCHGKLGKGGIGPNITYPKIKSVFNATTFSRAVTKGLDEAGKPLDKKMPRYGTVTPDDITGLWDFIKTLK